MVPSAVLSVLLLPLWYLARKYEVVTSEKEKENELDPKERSPREKKFLLIGTRVENWRRSLDVRKKLGKVDQPWPLPCRN